MNSKIIIITLLAIIVFSTLLFLIGDQKHKFKEIKQNYMQNKTQQNQNVQNKAPSKTKQELNENKTQQKTNNVVLVVDKYQNVLPLPIKPIVLDDINLNDQKINTTNVPNPIKVINLPNEI